MKYLILISVFGLSAFAAAAPVTVLECNTPVGPDQSVTVKVDGGAFVLIENTNHGDLQTRTLSPGEWNSGVLNLREEFGYRTTLTVDKNGEGYIHVTDGAGYNEFGPADCQ